MEDIALNSHLDQSCIIFCHKMGHKLSQRFSANRRFPADTQQVCAILAETKHHATECISETLGSKARLLVKLRPQLGSLNPQQNANTLQDVSKLARIYEHFGLRTQLIYDLGQNQGQNFPQNPVQSKMGVSSHIKRKKRFLNIPSKDVTMFIIFEFDLIGQTIYVEFIFAGYFISIGGSIDRNERVLYRWTIKI